MKNIILLSDGTGNSSAKLFKTNVWRMYQSLDLHDGAAQVACYNDGVGTSSFKPLAFLGGAFGWGLKRNVLHLYRFLCEAWEPGDRIYIFGFSRGAFTVRMLAGMVAKMGVLTGCDARTLAYAVPDTYRQYRNAATWRPPFYPVIRVVRDGLIRLSRAAFRQAPPPARDYPSITFVGVWDTVAAYGTPFAELTRGVDRWVYPLSFSDRQLSPKVETARQALALDDARDTFHPVLWDESQTPQPWERLQQVWFAGMHADVGGGYPDDALSRPPFDWMMQEAEAAGLRFLPKATERFTPPASWAAPMHDSRQGLGSYYRYQPRNIGAQMAPPDPDTRAMRDPSPKAKSLLRQVTVHWTVIERMRTEACRYAPIVLPPEFHVLHPDGTLAPFPEDPPARQARHHGQRAVWDWVWRKRVNYFLVVFLSLLLGLFPALDALSPATACQGVTCLLSPVIRGIGAFVPGALDPWFAAFASRPFLFLLLLAVLAGLGVRGSVLQRQIEDRMWQVWAPFRTGGRPAAADPPGWIRRLRTSDVYQSVWRGAKWRVLPAVFGIGLLGLIGLEAAYLVAATVLRVAIARAERSGAICRLDGTSDPAAPFRTNQVCWPIPTRFEAGTDYRIDIVIKDDDPWMDSTIPANPEGFGPERLPFPWGWLALPMRRSIEGRWFQPFLTLAPERGGSRRAYKLDFHKEGAGYTARFTPQRTGTASLWVNDVVVGLSGLSAYRYANNRGTANVTATPLPKLPRDQ